MKQHLAHSIFSIAPEREKEFDLSLDNFDLVYLPQRRWKFCADPMKRVIFVSRGAIELLWCASLAHYLFYHRFIQGKTFDKPTLIDPHSDADVDAALQLLNWALKCQFDGDESDNWPPGLPTPMENPPRESDLAMADELCLVSSAFLLHHELAHIRLKHTATNDRDWSLDQEKEADISAAEWVLDRVDVDGPFFVKRMLGIVQAFLLTTAVGLYNGSLGGETHPYSYDRMMALLNRSLGAERHITKDIAFAVLDLHFNNSKRKWNGGPFATAEEALDALCNRIANEVHGVPA